MDQANKTKIVLADDHEVFIDGMLRAFESHPEYEIVACFKNGEQLVQGVRVHRPDVVLTDIAMPVMDGIEAIKQIKLINPDILCVVLTSFDNEHLVLKALEAGALSYVNKSMRREVIFEAIQSSINGIPHHCTSTSQRVLRLINKYRFDASAKHMELFNSSEKKIIHLLTKDMRLNEIAAELCLGDRTVQWYKTQILEKMGVKTIQGIVVYAIRNKLVILDDSGI